MQLLKSEEAEFWNQPRPGRPLSGDNDQSLQNKLILVRRTVILDNEKQDRYSRKVHMMQRDNY